MMRPVLILGAIALASANDLATCAAVGAESMDNIVDVAINVWAATKRCNKGPASDAQCAVDISSSVQAVNDMVRTIIGAVEGCGAIHTSFHPCGMAVDELVSASAGLAAASAGLITHCPTALKQTDDDDGLDKSTALGKCIVDAKSSLRSLFSASGKLSKIHKDCKDGGTECNENAMEIVSALADLGGFLAAAVDDCSSYNGAGVAAAACASDSFGLVSALHSVAHAGIEIADKCKVTEEQRLYLQNDTPSPTASSMPLALAVLLPISVVLSFVAGSRFAKARARNAREADCEQLMQEE